MNKSLWKIILVYIITLFLTSCTYVKPPETLIRRPRNTIENENHDIIFKFLGESKVLTLAANQRDEEAIRRVDIDGDGQYELLVLYKDIDKKNKSLEGLGILILKKKGDEWYEINRIQEFVNNIDLVRYDDITGDGKPEIFIGTDNEDEVYKNLSVYSYHNGYFRSIYYSSYRDFGIGDLNGDGLNEIAIFDKKRESDVKYVKVLNYINDDMKTLDEYAIYNNSYYSTMIVGKASKDKMGIFIDYDVGSYNGYMDLLVMKDNRLIQVLSDIRIRYGQVFKNYIAESKDINDDGIIEMGFMGKIAIAKELRNEDIPYIHKWYQWNGKNDIALVRREYYNYDFGYKLLLPLKWQESFVILRKMDVGKIEVYSLDIARKLDKKIFTIMSFKKEDWEEEKIDLDTGEYIVLKQHSKNIIVATIQDKDKESRYYIDARMLKTMFYSIAE